MINRVLIRIKVVQLLYSYLLVQNNFAVKSSPLAPTKEKRFAYSLYLDYLYLMVKISERVEKPVGKYPLKNTRLMRRLALDNIIKSIKIRYSNTSFPLDSCVDKIAAEIKESALFKRFIKEPKADPTLWFKIFREFIAFNPDLTKLCESYENYSLRGVDRAQEMIRGTFKDLAISQDNIADGIEELNKSLDKARELYFRLLTLPIDITYQQEVELEGRKYNRLTPEDSEDLNSKFCDNELVKLLSDSGTISKYTQEHKISWIQQDREIIKHLLKEITSSDIYQSYISEPITDVHEDFEFWKKVMRHIILEDPEFLELMEKKSVFWNDDFGIIGEFVAKTFRRFEEKASGNGKNIGDPVLPMYKDEEDAEFGRELFEATVQQVQICSEYIDNALITVAWESDRLGYLDYVIMLTALAEILTFPKIPVQASLNEYIEIAKSYCSAKSGTFINGILADVISNLQASGIIRKNRLGLDIKDKNKLL